MADHTYRVGMAPVRETNGVTAPGEIIEIDGLVYERTRYHLYELELPEGGNIFTKKAGPPIPIDEFYDCLMETVLTELNMVKVFMEVEATEITKTA